jgi:transposase
MSQARTLDIGMDVHKDSMAVADVAPDHGAEVTDLGTIGTRQCDSDHLTRTLPAKATPLVFVSEAGPCGDWLSRYLTNKGHRGWVVAPALMPKQAGDRVNTDRRDAVQRARLMRSGDLTPVDVSAVEAEAIRDLSRARADAIRDRKTAKVRLNACLRRHDIRSTGRATWSPAPLRWRSAVGGATPAHQSVFQAYVRAVHAHTARLPRLDQERQEQVKSWRLPPVVAALEGLRGVPCTVAVTMVAARGDLTRFETPRPVPQYLGLIPAAYSSGERRRQGALTKAGHTHARHALGDGAWASRDPAKVSRHLQRRRETPPNVIQDISGKAQGRLCQRDRRVIARGQHTNPVVVAIARELAGFRWALAHQVSVTPSGRLTDGHVPHHCERAPPGLGRDAAPEWCNPRPREETGRHPRASSEAGTRRTPVRWSPTHG